MLAGGGLQLVVESRLCQMNDGTYEDARSYPT